MPAGAAAPADERPVVLFDGVCNLCNGIVRFVIARDPPPGRMRFAALQSEAGQRLLRRHRLPVAELESFVLVEGDRAWRRSTAALRVLRLLGFPWALLWGLAVVPAPLRDAVYGWFARRRYRWFGKRDACMRPTPDVRARFLD